MKKVVLLFSFLVIFSLNSMNKKCATCGKASVKTIKCNGEYKNLVIHDWEFHLTYAQELTKESRPEACDELIKIFKAVKYLPLKENLALKAVELLLKVEPLPKTFLVQEASEYIDLLTDGKIRLKKSNKKEEEIKEELEFLD